MLRRGAMLSLLALAPLASFESASAQAVQSPQNNFHAAVNGMVSLCPALVRGGPVPDAVAAAPFGFRPITSPAGEHRFESLFHDGIVQVHFEPAAHICTTHYSGQGFHAVAGVARDMAVENHFTRILHDDARPGILGDVFQRTVANLRARYIVGEFTASQDASVAYIERTNP